MTVFAIYDEDSSDQHSLIKEIVDGFYWDFKSLAEDLFRTWK
jgi:hypothetical protein